MKPWLASRAALAPDAPALIHDRSALSWAETAREAGRRAAALTGHGVRRGDRVALIPGPDSLDNALWMHAVWWCAAVLVPLDSRLPAARRAELVRRLGAARVVDLQASAQPGTPPDAEPRPAADVDPDRPATLLLTSGSTGPPRGVPMTLAQHRASAAAVAQRLGLRADDHWLACLPMTHIGGLAILIRAALTGACVELLDRFDAPRAADIIEARAITWTSLVPTQLADLLDTRKRPFRHRLRGVLVGGAAAAPELLDRARQMKLPVLPTWGMTEAGSQLATAAPEVAADIDWGAQPGRVGPPLPGVEVRAADDGRLQVRGPMLFSGYFDAYGSPGPDADGWFTTGDHGRLDEHGNVIVLGRADRVLVSGGVNVHLDAVERQLRASAHIADVAVIALPDRRWGQVPGALVVLSPAGTVDALSDWCRKHLAPAERPAYIVASDRVPRSSAGKPLHDEIARLLGA